MANEHTKSRVTDPTGVSPLYIMLEIHHYDRKLSKCSKKTKDRYEMINITESTCLVIDRKSTHKAIPISA